jgi:hypothetical protein
MLLAPLHSGLFRTPYNFYYLAIWVTYSLKNQLLIRSRLLTCESVCSAISYCPTGKKIIWFQKVVLYLFFVFFDDFEKHDTYDYACIVNPWMTGDGYCQVRLEGRKPYCN